MRKGNKQNAVLNGEYAKHIRKYGKKLTSKKRRNIKFATEDTQYAKRRALPNL